jgi:CRP-like cAMP-binding protein
MLVRNHLLNAFGDKALADLFGDLSEFVLSNGRVIHEPDHDSSEIYFPTSGVVSVITMMENGQAVESLTVGREGAIGLLSSFTGLSTDERAVVQIAGSAWKISAKRLLQHALAHPIIEDVALRYAQVLIGQLHQAAACNALHDAETRLCRWLLTCQDRVGDPLVPLTQELVAMMLGVQRTSVTLAAQALQRRGLIHYTRGRITILDREGLEKSSCECYRATEAVYARSFPRPLVY